MIYSALLPLSLYLDFFPDTFIMKPHYFCYMGFNYSDINLL
jgi:hypothetical protein